VAGSGKKVAGEDDRGSRPGQTQSVGLAGPKAGSGGKGVGGFLSSFFTLISCFCSHFSFLQYSLKGDVSNGDWRLQNSPFIDGLDLRDSLFFCNVVQVVCHMAEDSIIHLFFQLQFCQDSMENFILASGFPSLVFYLSF
jgi:hypothetical protein